MTDERKKRTPAQRAQEAFDVASRRVDRLRTVRDDLKVKLESAQSDLTAAEKRRDHAAQDPDLPAVQSADTYVEPGTEPAA